MPGELVEDLCVGDLIAEVALLWPLLGITICSNCAKLLDVDFVDELCWLGLG